MAPPRQLAQPLRAEILGADGLDRLAIELATTQRLVLGRPRPLLLRRLDANQRALRDTLAELARSARAGLAISPAAEWLLDNFFLVETQVREIREALPRAYYRELPKLADGTPRIYALAEEFVAHTDSAVDPALLRRFTAAYQTLQALTLGELWAVAISLRLVLVENLRRLAEQVAQRLRDRTEASALFDRLIAPHAEPAQLLERTARRLDSQAFVVELLQRLREPEGEAQPAALALSERLSALGIDSAEVIHSEHQRQASNQVTVANIIASFRQLGAIDWRDFVEELSVVEQTLGRDPAGVHAAQDFATRDRARHAVEELARYSATDELHVAERALAMATDAEPLAGRPATVVEFLLGDGRRRLEKALRFRPRARLRVARAVQAAGLPGYLTAVFALTIALVWGLHWLAQPLQLPRAMVWFLAALAALPASDAALALVQRWLAALVPPRPLAKLELEQGVPTQLRTLVAVPMMLTGAVEIAELVERLEVHYLANGDGDLRFALLADFVDAAAAHLAEDEARLAAAQAGIARLNERHGPAPDGGERFLLLWRERRYNAADSIFMGWERKRGKLHELNRLLRGATDTTYGAGCVVPPDVRYVLTLDADTRLPRGAAGRLVGTIAHPLNRPRPAAPGQPLTDGYAIIQPRTIPMLPPRGEESRYRWIFSGPTGLDPYVGAVSDLYQDLFAAGSYTGKGIYDIDAFEGALHGCIPENALLSHDLFESGFARTALATDVVLFEEFPAHAEVNASRQHRWMRGDWQLLPWLQPRVPAAGGLRRRNPLPALALWKIADNMRRTLVAPATLLLLLAGWWLAPTAQALVWELAIAALLALPILLPTLFDLLPRRRGIAKRTHAGALLRELVIVAAQTASALVFFAYRAMLCCDAIGRTLWRLLRRRRMLEWTTAALARDSASLDLFGFYRRAVQALGLAVAVGAALALTRPAGLPVALPILLTWLAAPALARWLSLPLPERRETPLSAAERDTLRGIARRTWTYFETFAGADENHLPADNLQEDPALEIAHRTSPTNIGLSLTASLAAYDFGWIGMRQTADRVGATLDTMAGLELYRGHFLNWYDTRTLRPLDPRYVSTVDSGNLAAHLLATAEGLREIAAAAPEHQGNGSVEFSPSAAATLRARRGAADTLRLLAEAAQRGGSRALARRAAACQSTLEGEAAQGWLERAIAEATVLEIGALALASGVPRGGPASAAAAVGAEPAALPDGTAPAAGTPAYWASAALATLQSHAHDIATLATPAARAAFSAHLRELARRADAMFEAMDFAFLLDPRRRLLAIGYRLGDHSLDPSFYDLLASEARLTSFLAVGKGDVSASHWFRLGRPMSPIGRGSALLSWSGSMFEYLMPALVLAEPAGSILDASEHLAVREQMRYGRRRRVPWGISESAYNARDPQLVYQYAPFGVPTLGMKRSPPAELVIAPYATGLAAMLEPRAALRNFERLRALGGLGDFGFYEAMDFTPARVPEGERLAVVRTYMGHHQAMTIVALANVLEGAAMRARFHRQPVVRAAELLLQERTPRDVLVARHLPEERLVTQVRDDVLAVLRRFETPHTSAPRAHALSNGRYTVVLTNSGGGFSRRGRLEVTRWREDATADAWGSFLYLRDPDSGRLWSAGYQPTRAEPDEYAAMFGESRVEIARRDGPIGSLLEVVVSREHDAELRRLTLVNHSTRPRRVEVTSYAEIVLAPAGEDEAHRAFAGLFVETEFVRAPAALLATRRPRSPETPRVWAAHVVALSGGGEGPLQWNTDRARFLGRNRDPSHPEALTEGQPLAGAAGAVIDPIFSFRQTVVLPAGGQVRLLFTTLLADTRDEAIRLAEHYSSPLAWQRATSMAWTFSQVELRGLGMSVDEAHLFQRLASRALYTEAALRSPVEVLERNRLGQSALWPHGVSGDAPIVLLRIDDVEHKDIARQLLRALAYWRSRGLAIDLVILNEHPASYVQLLQAELESLAKAMGIVAGPAANGGLFLLRADQMSGPARDLLRASARVVLLSHRGSLADQLLRATALTSALPRPAPSPRALHAPAPAPAPSSSGLEVFNGLGGFADRGRSYEILLDHGQRTPAPWINVVTNRHFGFQVSEAGAGFTWAVNSRERRLTPWSNDAVSDPAGEAIYVRDEATGELISPTLLPLGDDGQPYVCRHGRGWSRFRHQCNGLELELLQLVAPDDPVKISRLAITNRSSRERSLSVAAYAEWALAASRTAVAPWTVTERDGDSGAILARNSWTEEFSGRVAFAMLGGAESATGDRREFLGRNGAAARPAGLAPGNRLSGRVGAALDPCAAFLRPLRLAAGESAEILFLLGDGDNADQARDLISRYRHADVAALQSEVERRWDDITGALQVETPDRAFDLMVNHWLLYQTLACRLWARSAFYQSSGAFGFRDQLQDAMAVVVAAPSVAREQILRAAGRQFPEGDVQHWWHEPSGRGVRTHCSDDLLWLPYAAAHYVSLSGDPDILAETTPFLEQPALAPGAQDDYRTPERSALSASLYEHCVRAIELSLTRLGERGLPLFGGGDWNDGMNRVGVGGTGESVWLGWFLCSVIEVFAPLAAAREPALAERWHLARGKLAAALESEGWDGGWYRRGFYDDGTPLGSHVSEECRIDSIAQSWAVLSHTADPGHARQAMAAVEQYLVRKRDALVLLFTPPFSNTDGPHDPGYIRGYPPGVRENGGQYTHGAIWTVLALAELGDGERAYELFSLLNPIHHGENPAGVHRYHVEPYVAAADIYSEPPYVGRGGWTWYTGSAGWMYRAAVEWILGFRLRGASLQFVPCIPRAWPGYRLRFRYHSSTYLIEVLNPTGSSRDIARVELDGLPLAGATMPLSNDGREHYVQVTLGEADSALTGVEDKRKVEP